ncbi:Sortase-like acyltransferase [Agrobacterium deltaense Zutra 3/1]|uniref:Sortase-like acyltransferase n=2 Tax=Agrobacterium deltaense TaxID=1183412 RepID=A0A1S7P2A5_9HYPH|nr:Sortase-like acyltransferase [Agrobacterium deltaense Zutra 3/1]
MKIRPAKVDDATGMAAVQNEIFSAGLRKAPTDITAVLENYIQHADRIECSVAEDDDGRILGFQSLRYARTGNPYGVAEGWGIIGTHVSPQAARRGVGSALFAATRRAAEARGIQNIDATIGADNMLGQSYYDAMGFTTYRQPEGLVCKVYRLG